MQNYRRVRLSDSVVKGPLLRGPFTAYDYVEYSWHEFTQSVNSTRRLPVPPAKSGSRNLSAIVVPPAPAGE